MCKKCDPKWELVDRNIFHVAYAFLFLKKKAENCILRVVHGGSNKGGAMFHDFIILGITLFGIMIGLVAASPIIAFMAWMIGF